MEKRTIWAGAALAGMVFVVFGRTTTHGFLSWDDRANFLENPHLSTESLGGIGAFWAESFGQLYIPLTYTVWGFLARLGGWLGAELPAADEAGVVPALFHGTNVVLHAGSAVLVFLILRRVVGGEGRGTRVEGREREPRMDANGREGGEGTAKGAKGAKRGEGNERGEDGGDVAGIANGGTLERSLGYARDDKALWWPALLGAAVFAVHPVQVEAVAWATGMKDVLSGFLGLAAMLMYLGTGHGAKGAGPEEVSGVRCQVSGGSAAVGGMEVDGGAHVEGRTKAAVGLPQSEGSVRDRGSLSALCPAPYALCPLLLFVLALLAKPGAAAVPVMLLGLEVLALGENWKRSAARLWPWFLAALAVVLVTREAQGGMSGFAATGTEAGAPLWLRPFVYLDALGFYTGKVIAPLGLGVDYGRTPQWLLESGQWRVTWVAAAAVTACAVMGVSGKRRTTNGHEGARMGEGRASCEGRGERVEGRGARGEGSDGVEGGAKAAVDPDAPGHSEGSLRARGAGASPVRLLAGAWFVFAAGVLPASGLVTFAFQAHSTVADRYLYLAMLGVAVAVAVVAGIERRAKGAGRQSEPRMDAKGREGEEVSRLRPSASARQAGVPPSPFGFGAAGRCRAFALRLRRGRQVAGESEPWGPAESKIEERTSNIGNRKSGGVLAAGLGLVAVLGILSSWQVRHWRDSRALAARALEVNPESAEFNYARANQVYDTGDVETAIAFYRKAIAVDARHWRAHHLLANALGEKGDWRRALAHLGEAETIMPSHPAVLGDLGYALAATGDRAAAEESYRRALAAAPEDVRSRHDLGVLLLERGAFGEAVAELRRAWAVAPDETTAWNFRKALERYADEREGEGDGEGAAALRREAGALRAGKR